MLTKQEMFNKAYLGLASQGFERCGEYRAGDSSGLRRFVCEYSNREGTRHCAWGWVDTSIPYGTLGRVTHLAGIALTLSNADLTFATRLQLQHDVAASPNDMKNRLHTLASDYGLTVPTP